MKKIYTRSTKANTNHQTVGSVLKDQYLKSLAKEEHYID